MLLPPRATPAVMAAALFALGRIGVSGPLGSIYPASPEPCLVIDIGATQTASGVSRQFAHMGHLMPGRCSLAQPKVGIISNAMNRQGQHAIRETYPLLKASGSTSSANEGKDIGAARPMSSSPTG